MKVSRMASGDSAELIVSFQVECQIQQVLTGPHVPRFVAAGDLERMPYLVMEYIAGRTLQHWLDAPQPLEVDVISRLGVAMARAAHALHLQNTVHLDLSPKTCCSVPHPMPPSPKRPSATRQSRCWPLTCRTLTRCTSPSAAPTPSPSRFAPISNAESRPQACITSPARCPPTKLRKCPS